MTIDLDKEIQRLIEQAAFVDADKRGPLGYTREQIDAMIAGAIDSLDRGEGVDGEEFFRRLGERTSLNGSDVA